MSQPRSGAVRPRPAVRRADAPAAPEGPESLASFAAAELAALERAAARQGVVLRPARLEDLAAIHRLHLSCFRPPPERRINGYELYRILRFGLAAVLDRAGEVVGYDLAASFASEPPACASAGIAVHPAIRDRRLATALVRYSMVRAMAAGSRRRHGVVSPRNLSSLSVLLNHLGCVCDGFLPRFTDWGESRLTHRCDLTPETLRRGGVIRARLARFFATAREGEDYLLLAPEDDDALAELYRAGRFRIGAVVPLDFPEDPAATGGRLVALPVREPPALGERRRAER